MLPPQEPLLRGGEPRGRRRRASCGRLSGLNFGHDGLQREICARADRAPIGQTTQLARSPVLRLAPASVTGETAAEPARVSRLLRHQQVPALLQLFDPIPLFA